MKIAVPQSSSYQRVRIEVTGPNTLKQMEAICDDVKVIERNFDDDERLLRVTAQFISVSGDPMGDELVLKEAEVDEPFDYEFDEPESTVPESEPESESVQLPVREPEPDTVPDTEESDEEILVGDPDDAPAEEVDVEFEEVLDEEPSDEE